MAASALRPAIGTGQRRTCRAAETVARHGETDEAEDDLFGGGVSGDEVPEDAWRPGRRDERIAAALASLRAGRAAPERAQADNAQAWRAPPPRRPPAGPAAAAHPGGPARGDPARGPADP